MGLLVAGIVAFAFGIGLIVGGVVLNTRSFAATGAASTRALRVQAAGMGLSLLGSAAAVAAADQVVGSVAYLAAAVLAIVGVAVLAAGRRIRAR